MSEQPTDCDPLTAATHAVVMRYHLSWKARDLDAVMALYHPQIEYHDLFQNCCFHYPQLRDYVRDSLCGAAPEHQERIRVDGDTAFFQYRLNLQGGNGSRFFRSCEAITVRDGLIWRISEYAVLVNLHNTTPTPASNRPAVSRLGLSARQLGVLADDLQQYFQRAQPYLEPSLDLQQVATATGYSRNQLSYLLNQVFGQSFYHYVNQARLEHLLAALDNSPEISRIDELAFAAGFNSLSAFYKCFRQRTGLTPKAYLQQLSLRARTHDTP
jgi:AraC-like DNA-binding protein